MVLDELRSLWTGHYELGNAAGRAPFGSWNTQTFIAGLTCSGMIAPWIIKGAMDGAAFETYVRTQLAPALEPRTVVILDNLATHRNPGAAKALREQGCWFLYLPPYKPRPEPHRAGIRKAQGPPQAHRRKDIRAAASRHRRHLRNVQPSGMLELPQKRRIRLNVKSKRFMIKSSRS
jgi:transposase